MIHPRHRRHKDSSSLWSSMPCSNLYNSNSNTSSDAKTIIVITMVWVMTCFLVCYTTNKSFSSYHVDIVEYLHRSYVQMRNPVSASFQRYMRLPDPSSPNLNFEYLPEIIKQQLILSNYLQHLQSEPCVTYWMTKWVWQESKKMGIIYKRLKPALMI